MRTPAADASRSGSLRTWFHQFVAVVPHEHHGGRDVVGVAGRRGVGVVHLAPVQIEPAQAPILSSPPMPGA